MAQISIEDLYRGEGGGAKYGAGGIMGTVMQGIMIHGVRREFDYYEKVDSYMATLVPLVQDLEYWATKAKEGNTDNAKEKYREHLLEYLKMIPEIKNDSVLFQPYIPSNVFKAVGGC